MLVDTGSGEVMQSVTERLLTL